MYEIATGDNCSTSVPKGMDERDRIKEALENHQELTRDSLAAAMRVSVPSLGRLLRKERALGAAERDRAFTALGLAQGVRQVPVIGTIPAGQWQEAIEHPLGYDWCWVGGPSTFSLVVEGDSMNRVIVPGAHVAIDPDQRELISRKVYAVMDAYGEATLKRFVSDPARLEPDSTNSSHQPMVMGRDEIRIIGRALMVLRDPNLEL